MNNINHPVAYEVDKVGMSLFQLKHMLERFSLNKTDLQVLAYISVHRNKAEQEILSNKILGSQGSVTNYISRLRSQGFVQGSSKKNNLRLVEALDIVMEDITYTFTLKLIDQEYELRKEEAEMEYRD